MIEVSNNSVLIVIDVQKGFDDPKWGKRNNLDAENVMARVLSEFRKHKLTVIHVRHDSRNPESLLKEGKPAFAFKDEVKPLEGEIVITKHVNSAFIDTNLEEILRKMGDPNVYYMGITTDHCVSTTARMSGNLGFKSYVIEDACAAFEKIDQHGKMISADTIHNVNLASIHGEFAQVIGSEDLVF